MRIGRRPPHREEADDADVDGIDDDDFALPMHAPPERSERQPVTHHFGESMSFLYGVPPPAPPGVGDGDSRPRIAVD